jgi:hypothetical protein
VLTDTDRPLHQADAADVANGSSQLRADRGYFNVAPMQIFALKSSLAT